MKFLIIIFALIFFASTSHGYNDDSYDDTALWESVNGNCIGGRVVVDTKNIRFSCTRDEVRLVPKTKRLYKNNIQFRADDIKDFKVSRNGKVFFRDRDGYLYDERGKLVNLGSRVTLYLVSTSGDLVYLDQRGDLFKNGQQLASNEVIHKAFKTVRYVNGRRLRIERGVTINPAISRNGSAVYIDRRDKSVPKSFRGIGVRIEDDVLVTRTGHRVLTAGVPKEVRDVEAACN